MEIPKIARTVARKLLGRRATRYVRRWIRRTVPDIRWYWSSFSGAQGLEIGGPSGIFGEEGSVPVYRVLKSLDNCLFSNRTIWEGKVVEGRHFNYHPHRPLGFQYILEGTELRAIADSVYDSILSSHTLEHIANPLGALREWKRVVKIDGLLLIVLPHKDGTFDWRRSPTKLTHMIEDFDRNTGEDDLSHVPEVLALHDLKRDKDAGTIEDFRSRCLENHSYRAVHHHVFDTPTAVAMLDYAGFQILRVDLWRPCHIILVSRRCRHIPNNHPFLAADAEYRRRSPFLSDRLKASS